ncbi:MAG: hypothetical protein ACFE0O_13885 [Opitutales bacterium]
MPFRVRRLLRLGLPALVLLIGLWPMAAQPPAGSPTRRLVIIGQGPGDPVAAATIHGVRQFFPDTPGGGWTATLLRPDRRDPVDQADLVRQQFIHPPDAVWVHPIDLPRLGPALAFLTDRGLAVRLFGSAVSNRPDQPPLAAPGSAWAGLMLEAAGQTALRAGAWQPVFGGSAGKSGTEQATLEAAWLSASAATGLPVLPPIRVPERFGESVAALAARPDPDRRIGGWLFFGAWPFQQPGSADIWNPNGLPVIACGATPAVLTSLARGELTALLTDDPVAWGRWGARQLEDPDDDSPEPKLRILDNRLASEELERWKTLLRSDP